MSRRARIGSGELIYHTLNRANGRNELFSRRLCRVLSDYGSRRLNPLSTNVADLEKQWLEEERRASRFFPLGMTPSNAFTRN